MMYHEERPHYEFTVVRGGLAAQQIHIRRAGLAVLLPGTTFQTSHAHVRDVKGELYRQPSAWRTVIEPTFLEFPTLPRVMTLSVVGGVTGVITHPRTVSPFTLGFWSNSDSPTYRHQPTMYTAKPWGVEVTGKFNSMTVQLKIMRVVAGGRTSLQLHRTKDEVMFMLEGDGEVEPLDAPRNTMLTLPPRTVHRVSGPRFYLEASTYGPNDVIRIEDDYDREVA